MGAREPNSIAVNLPGGNDVSASVIAKAAIAC